MQGSSEGGNLAASCFALCIPRSLRSRPFRNAKGADGHPLALDGRGAG